MLKTVRPVISSYFFHFEDYTGRFYASRDIKADEEITIMYTNPLESRAVRRDSLIESHHFVCTCNFCLLPAEASKASDGNRLFVKTVLKTLSVNPPVKVRLAQLRKAIQLAESEQLLVYKVQLYHLGACSLMLQGNEEKRVAQEWLKKAKEGYGRTEGRESYHIDDLVMLELASLKL